MEKSPEEELLNIDNPENHDTISSHSTFGDTPIDVRRLIGDDGDEEVEEELLPTGVINASFLSLDCVGCPAKGIAPGIVHLEVPFTEVIASDEQNVFKEMYEVVGGSQVTGKKLNIAPLWILAKVVEWEVESNRIVVYTEIREIDVLQDANVTTFHFVYKINSEEKGVNTLKAGLCPHGNKDRFKKSVRKDSATARFDVIRLLLSI